MILLDKALWRGLRFVLENVSRAAEGEVDDAPRLRERLMDAQLRFEAGEIGADELAELETRTLARLRELDAPDQRGPIGVATVEIDVSEESPPTRSRKSRGHSRRGAS